MMTSVRNAQAAQSELPIYERPESLAADPALAPVANFCVHEAADIDAMRRAGAFERWAGKRVAIFAPSYQFLTRTGDIHHARREAALENCRRCGLEPVLLEHVLEQTGRFAGSDQVRAADLMRALTMPEIDLAMPIRGGYGMTRLLPLLDWSVLAEAKTPIVGFSDFTALNLALFAQTGRASWHGPMLGSFANPDRFALERFAVVFGDEPGPLAWRHGRAPKLPDWARTGVHALEGTLWGGNLALVSSLVGSPWLPEVSDGILFLEDVDEAAYRVERMLLTLLDAGILERQRAILLGDFAGANNAWRFPGDATLARVFDYIRSRLPERVLMVSGLPFGHVPHQATLPVGVAAHLTLEAGSAKLTWLRSSVRP